MSDNLSPHALAPLIKRLRRYNDWRRGAEFEQPSPLEIGQDLDLAADMLERLGATETSTGTDDGARFEEIVRLLRDHRAQALALLPQCQVDSTGYFWCQGRIDATENVLLKAGVALDA